MLTQKRLKEVLRYYPESGIFIRRIKTGPNCSDVGLRVGCDNGKGYIYIRIDGGQYYAHRLAWLYIYGYFPENTIDHINRNRLDNRISNLREATKQCQARNCDKNKKTISGIKGVEWNKKLGKWAVSIGNNGKKFHIGVHKNKI